MSCLNVLQLPFAVSPWAQTCEVPNKLVEYDLTIQQGKFEMAMSPVIINTRND